MQVDSDDRTATAQMPAKEIVQMLAKVPAPKMPKEIAQKTAKKPATLSRRGFLRGALLASAIGFVPDIRALMAAPLSFSKDLVVDGEVITAAHWGMLKVTIKGGRIKGSAPAIPRSHVKNPLQFYVKDLVENTRVLHPMVRKSFYENPQSPKPELRGRDEWVQVSYKEAIALASEALKRTIDRHGNDAIFGGSYGWKSSGRLHSANTLLQRFLGTIGGFTNGIGDYSAGATEVLTPHVMGTISSMGQMTSWEVLLKEGRQIVIWGANPLITVRNSSACPDGFAASYFEQLRDKMANNEIEVLLIDPVYNETASFLKIPRKNHIAPIQGSDTALMLGIMHELYTSGRYDKGFIDTYTVGFDKFLPYLLGKSDGVPKTKAFASKITGIDESTIERLAKSFVAMPTLLMTGWAMQRQDHGEQAPWMLITLASMIGQMGTKGGGIGFSYHRSSGVPFASAPVVGGISAACQTPSKSRWSRGRNFHHIAIPVARITECIMHPHKTIDFNGTKITYPEIRLVYWAGGNPIVHQQDTNKNLEAFRSLDAFIVNEIYFTPTARMADIILPATTSYERNDMIMTGDFSMRDIAPMKACVAPRGEARSDYEIFSDLAREFGTYDSFTEGGRSEFDWLRLFYAQALSQAKGLMVDIPSFEAFWKANKPLSFAASEEGKNHVHLASFREDPILSPLGTPSGLIEIYSETIAAMRYDDCPPHASYIEPIEWLGMQDKKAAFALISPHPNDRIHSQLSNTALRKKYAIAGREPIWINKKDARRLGIKTGDIVRVFNARGEVLAGAKVTKNIAPNTVRLAEGAWYAPIDGSKNALCLNGCVNLLTIDKPSSKLAVATIAHTALVNVEKYKGKAPRVYVFDTIRPVKVV